MYKCMSPIFPFSCLAYVVFPELREGLKKKRVTMVLDLYC